MDLHCPRCGEPVDNDELHAVAEETGNTYSSVLAAFRHTGCPALPGGRHNLETIGSDLAILSAAAFDLMPDDPDGVAAMIEDFG